MDHEVRVSETGAQLLRAGVFLARILEERAIALEESRLDFEAWEASMEARRRFLLSECREEARLAEQAMDQPAGEGEHAGGGQDDRPERGPGEQEEGLELGAS
jgi:hypothetical protein